MTKIRRFSHRDKKINSNVNNCNKFSNFASNLNIQQASYMLHYLDDNKGFCVDVVRNSKSPLKIGIVNAGGASFGCFVKVGPGYPDRAVGESLEGDGVICR